VFAAHRTAGTNTLLKQPPNQETFGRCLSHRHQISYPSRPLSLATLAEMDLSTPTLCPTNAGAGRSRKYLTNRSGCHPNFCAPLPENFTNLGRPQNFWKSLAAPNPSAPHHRAGFDRYAFPTNSFSTTVAHWHIQSAQRGIWAVPVSSLAAFCPR